MFAFCQGSVIVFAMEAQTRHSEVTAAEVVPGSATWWLARRSQSDRRPRKDGLTLESIVEVALAVVSADGAHALTMRRVAEELNTGAASLYRHVGGRDELIALVVDHVLGTMDPIQPTKDDWRATMEDAARTFRSHLYEHLNVVPLMRSAQMLGPNSMAAREVVLSTLIGRGLKAEDAISAYLAIVHFAVANVQLDARSGAHDELSRQDRATLFASLDAAQFPCVVEHADELAAHTNEREFDFGLGAILDRVERLASPK